jgi:hypothetical protein
MGRAVAALVGVSISLLLWAAVASAATVQVVGVYYKPIHEADRVDYVAGAGEANDLVITEDGDTVVVTDVVPITPGPGCAAAVDGSVRCAVTSGLGRFARVRLQDGNDRARIVGGLSTSLRGGDGDDRLFADPGFSAGFIGGRGDDLMVGGVAGDSFNEEAERNGSDTMLSLRPGTAEAPSSNSDHVSYEKRRGGVHADAEGDRDDGERGERDRIGPGVDDISGGSGPDTLIGDSGKNGLYGYEGRDLLRGGGGPDWLTGDTWVIDKPRSADRIFGGTGDDHIEAGAGTDRIAAGTGRDSIVAGPGPDRIDARDALLDAVVCGIGRDRVVSDRHDFLSRGCERHGAFARQPVPMVFSDAGEVASVLLGCPLSHDCTGEASVELNGQSLGTTQFSLTRGSYAFIYVPLAGRSSADYLPPIDDAILHIGTRRYPAATIPDFYLPLELDL